MKLNIVENCQWLKHEVTTHWKTGVVMVGVAVVVGTVYGKVAVVFTLLFSVRNYDMLSQPIHTLTLIKVVDILPIVAILGLHHFYIVSAEGAMLMTMIWDLMKGSRSNGEKEKLAEINSNVSKQCETLETNNKKLTDAYDGVKGGLKELTENLDELLKSASDLQKAKEENSEIIQIVEETIPEEIKKLPTQLLNVNTLLKELLSNTKLKSLLKLREEARAEISQLLNELKEKLQALTGKAEDQVTELATAALEYERNVMVSRQEILATRQIVALAIEKLA